MYYIIDGQHQYTACMAIRQQCIDSATPIPPWTERFRCTVLKEMPLADVRRVAGRCQRAANAALGLKFSETMAIFLIELRNAPGVPMSEVLKNTYGLSGKTATHDGSLV